MFSFSEMNSPLDPTLRHAVINAQSDSMVYKKACLMSMYRSTVEPRYKGPAYKSKPDIKVNVYQF